MNKNLFYIIIITLIFAGCSNEQKKIVDISDGANPLPDSLDKATIFHVESRYVNHDTTILRLALAKDSWTDQYETMSFNPINFGNNVKDVVVENYSDSVVFNIITNSGIDGQIGFRNMTLVDGKKWHISGPITVFAKVRKDSFFVKINSSKFVSTGKDISIDNTNFRQVGDSLKIQIYSANNNTDLTITNENTGSIVYFSNQNPPGLTTKRMKTGNWISGNSDTEIIKIEVTNHLQTISYYFPMK